MESEKRKLTHKEIMEVGRINKERAVEMYTKGYSLIMIADRLRLPESTVRKLLEGVL